MDKINTPIPLNPPLALGLQVATVQQLEGDPDGAFRIRVQLPSEAPDSKGTWARVSHLYTSSKGGTFFLPEIGDEVVVGFLDQDVKQPIVLGVLNNAKSPPPIPHSNDNSQKQLGSKTQLILAFDDQKKEIEISTPGGNTITLSEQNKSIRLVDMNKNEIVMDNTGISLESPSDIRIKSSKNIQLTAGGNLDLVAKANLNCQGLNISHKANVQFSAAGNAGAELKTSAIAIIQGTLVKIN